MEEIALSMLSPWERWRLKKKFEEEKQKELKIAKEKVETSAKVICMMLFYLYSGKYSYWRSMNRKKKTWIEWKRK